MKKRILAVVLCLAMLLSVVPFTLTASAAPADDNKVMFAVTDDADGKLYYTGYTYGINGLGYTQTGFLKQADGVKYTTGDGAAYLFADEIDGEKMWKIDFNVDENGNHKKIGGGGTYIYPFYSALKENGTAIPSADVECLADNFADAAEYTHLAIRIKFVDDGTGNYKEGSTQPFSINLLDAASSDGAYGTWLNKGGVYFQDINTGEKISVTKNCMQLPLGFDGYLVFPTNAVAGTGKTLADLVKVHIFLHWNCKHTSPTYDANNSWVGTEFYIGDMILTKNIDSFNKVYTTPAFALEAGVNTITVKSDEADVVYSLKKDAAANEWLAKDAFNATLANLEVDKEYTVYAKYTAGQAIAAQSIWTNPRGTHIGDGAIYLHDAPANGSLSYKSYKYDWGMGWSSTGAGRLDTDAGFTTGDGTQYLFFKHVDGENFLEVQDNPDKNCVQYTIAPHWINTGAATTIGQSIPEAADYEYIGIRLKFKGVEGQVSKLSVILRAEDGADAQYGQMAERKGSWLVDINNGNKIDIKNVAQQIPYNFDGWLIAPKDAITSKNYEKRYTIADLKSILFYHHQGCAHYADGSDWTNTTLYIGDIVAFDDAELFTNVRICGKNGHIEGTAATCKDKAICKTCGQAYGEVNPTAHGTNTELRDVVIADCKQDGYTGDTWCLDCNTKIGTGTSTPKGNHADADGKWETDGTNHWHTCSCGEILDKDAHKGGSASCSLQAVCDICKVGYGELDVDNHCDQDAKYEFNDTEHFYTCDCGKTFGNAKHEGGTATCKDKAICKVCKQPYGDVDATNHAGETEVKDAVDATCGKEGYTGDTYCKDCNTKIKDGEKIAATGNHTAAEELVNQKDATTTEKGYTGDKVCKDCGFVMEKGEDIPVLAGDDNKDEDTTTPGGDATTPDDDKTEGDSTTGGEGTDNDNAGAGSEDDGNASPETGDNASILVAVLAFLMAGAVVVLAKKRA